MMRTCGGCGIDFQAERSTAKYCSTTCRSRGNRRGDASSLPPVEPTTLRQALVRQLTEAGRLDTVLGQQALELAEAISSPLSTGAAKASLSKELRAVMTEALKGAHAAADPIDELRRLREQKLAAG